eukprot:TRINITY_DN2058_c0_g1_i5.p1 TRINITY_DN2058_c0_g1~~TRINITY_DN2058_c0_g1_i5.p1  ORF type:complete len:916 (+),score=300.42 TRINITY_DN2058_c0_g1_i5:137-2884(+)
MDMDAGVRVNGISQADVAKFETLFKLLDVEETGVIQEEQLADLMPRMGVFLSEEGLHSLFQSVDVDGSGNIDFNEFLMLMARHREANQLALLKGGRECFRYLKAASTLNHVSRSDSISNWIFDLVSLVTILWYVGIVLYEDVRQKSFPYAAGPYLKTVFGVYCFVDIARWARTALPSEDGPDTLPVDDATRVRSHYIRSRAFIFDALAALPLDLLFLYMGDDMVMRWCQHLRLFKLFTYSRLFRLSAQDTISPAYARFYFAVVPLCKILFLACVSIHILSMLWIVISPDSPDYVPSVYFVVYTLTTTGYGDIDVTTDLQRMFAIFLFVCASIVTGLVVGKLVQISQQGDLQGDMSRTMLETLAALSHLTIPPDFREEVLAFQLHRLKHSNSLFNDTISGLPRCMQDRMALYARMKIVRLVPIFSEVAEIGVAKLAQSLVTVFVSPEEYIVIAGEEGEEMFILFHGMCCVTLANGKWVATIKRGGVFGEKALLEATRRSASIKSLTYCQLFRLDKTSFEAITNTFPELLQSIKSVSFALRNRLEKKAPPEPDGPDGEKQEDTSDGDDDDKFCGSPPDSLSGDSHSDAEDTPEEKLDVVSVTEDPKGPPSPSNAEPEPRREGLRDRMSHDAAEGGENEGGKSPNKLENGQKQGRKVSAWSRESDPGTGQPLVRLNSGGRLTAADAVPKKGHKRNRFEHLKRKEDKDRDIDGRSDPGLFTVSTPSLPVFNAIPLTTRPTSELIGDSAFEDTQYASMRELLTSVGDDDPVSQLPISGTAIGSNSNSMTVSFARVASADRLSVPSPSNSNGDPRRLSAVSSASNHSRTSVRGSKKIVSFAPSTKNGDKGADGRQEKAGRMVKKASKMFKSLLRSGDPQKKMVIVPQSTLLQIERTIDSLAAGLEQLREMPPASLPDDPTG